MSKRTAHIENWMEYPCYPDGIFLIGTISKHEQQNSFLTDTQRTTKVVNIDYEKGIAETQNTIYTLGKKFTNG